MKNKNKYTRNIKVFISFIILTITLMNVLTISSYDVYAIEKPTYGDWIKDLYGYDENMPSDELDEKIKEDEAGRVFYKNPKTLTYEEFNGQAQVISETSGFMISGSRLGDSEYIIIPNGGEIALPYFNQHDYKHIKYDKSNFSTSGCFPTSLAMIVNGISDQKIVDFQAYANWICSKGLYKSGGSGSSWALPPAVAKKYGLNCNEIRGNDKQSVMNALASGHPIAMSCKRNGTFTSPNSGHMIVLNGIDENGMVSVLDPNRRDRCKKYPIGVIMNNASQNGAKPFWEIYK